MRVAGRIAVARFDASLAVSAVVASLSGATGLLMAVIVPLLGH
jgi:hypothetical protein